MSQPVPRRDPGPTIRHVLRTEVNFGCPVRFVGGGGCGCPILTYHHFDPPWAVGHLHQPDGMIALCPEHHLQADGGLWTNAQLREMKRSPFVDSKLNVRWPWQTERMLIKVGPCLVLEGGCAIRLDGRPVVRFTPAELSSLGTRVALLDSRVCNQRGEEWLNIRDGWLDLDVTSTADATFTARSQRFAVRGVDGAWLSLRFRRPPAVAFRRWLPTFWNHRDGHSGVFEDLEARGAIDSDGCIPYVEVEGHFETSSVEVKVREHNLVIEIPSLGERGHVDFHSHLVDDKRRAALKWGDLQDEFFSVG